MKMAAWTFSFCDFILTKSALPVGSSAKITFGLFIMLLQIQARCSCPPETSLMSLSATSMIPSLRISAWPRSVVSLRDSLILRDWHAGRMTLSRMERFFSMYIC